MPQAYNFKKRLQYSFFPVKFVKFLRTRVIRTPQISMTKLFAKIVNGVKLFYFAKCSLREKCPNTEFFLVRVFLYSDWIEEKFWNVSLETLIGVSIFTQKIPSDFEDINKTLAEWPYQQLWTINLIFKVTKFEFRKVGKYSWPSF